MICTKCNNEMTQVVKHGLAIDTCAMCGGIWLDKGKLGELMARTMQAESSLDQELSRVQSPRPDYGRAYDREVDRRYQDHDREHDQHDKHKYKKKSLWDIFD